MLHHYIEKCYKPYALLTFCIKSCSVQNFTAQLQSPFWLYLTILLCYLQN